MAIKVKVEFAGGLELLFEGKKSLTLEDLPESMDIRALIEELRAKHLKEKEEMFVQAQSVRAGIIVMVNETDWELEGGLDCQLANNDVVAFISTLHGG